MTRNHTWFECCLSEECVSYKKTTTDRSIRQLSWHTFFKKSFARFPVLVRLALRSLFGFIWFISGVFALFSFLSSLYVVPLPKILASRLVASLVLIVQVGLLFLSVVRTINWTYCERYFHEVIQVKVKIEVNNLVYYDLLMYGTSDQIQFSNWVVFLTYFILVFQKTNNRGK